MSEPPNRDVRARQAYGFFYLRPEREADALDVALREVRLHREAFEGFMWRSAIEHMLAASSMEELFRHLHYDVHRDGQERIVRVLRRDGPIMRPALDQHILEAVAEYTEGIAMVFANPFGDGWEWRTDGGRLRYREGRVTVAEATS